jgi:DNA-binding LytR/AlgR family response regulator
MTRIDVLLVEDEIIIAEDIKIRLENMGFTVTQSVDNVESAIQWLDSNFTDLVIIDIALKGSRTGIELADVINKQFHLPFIYLTSLTDEDIVKKAIETSPAAYLLKPFNDNQIRISIEMAFLNFYREENGAKHTENPELSLKMGDALFLKKDCQYKKEKFCDILWLEAESNYTTIKTRDGKYVYSTVLKNFEDKLPADVFARVHRSYIVNMYCVTGFEGNMLIVDGKYIPVSRSSRESIFKRFQTI